MSYSEYEARRATATALNHAAENTNLNNACSLEPEDISARTKNYDEGYADGYETAREIDDLRVEALRIALIADLGTHRRGFAPDELARELRPTIESEEIVKNKIRKELEDTLAIVWNGRTKSMIMEYVVDTIKKKLEVERCTPIARCASNETPNEQESHSELSGSINEDTEGFNRRSVMPNEPEPSYEFVDGLRKSPPKASE